MTRYPDFPSEQELAEMLRVSYDDEFKAEAYLKRVKALLDGLYMRPLYKGTPMPINEVIKVLQKTLKEKI